MQKKYCSHGTHTNCSSTYEYEQEAKNEVANIANDAVESREGESAGDAPGVAAEGVVVAEVLIAADVQ